MAASTPPPPAHHSSPAASSMGESDAESDVRRGGSEVVSPALLHARDRSWVRVAPRRRALVARGSVGRRRPAVLAFGPMHFGAGAGALSVFPAFDDELVRSGAFAVHCGATAANSCARVPVQTVRHCNSADEDVLRSALYACRLDPEPELMLATQVDRRRRIVELPDGSSAAVVLPPLHLTGAVARSLVPLWPATFPCTDSNRRAVVAAGDAFMRALRFSLRRECGFGTGRIWKPEPRFSSASEALQHWETAELAVMSALASDAADAASNDRPHSVQSVVDAVRRASRTQCHTHTLILTDTHEHTATHTLAVRRLLRRVVLTLQLCVQ
jgi:hypothetical protein